MSSHFKANVTALDLISKQNTLMVSWLSQFPLLPCESIGYIVWHVLSHLGMGDWNYFFLKKFSLWKVPNPNFTLLWFFKNIFHCFHSFVIEHILLVLQFASYFFFSFKIQADEKCRLFFFLLQRPFSIVWSTQGLIFIFDKFIWVPWKLCQHFL